MNSELYELRTYYHLGNYAAARTEGEALATSLTSPAAITERDTLMARVSIADGHASEVVAAIPASPPPAPSLMAVRLHASYVLADSDAARAEVVAALAAALTPDDPPAPPPDATLRVIGAAIYGAEGDWDAALRAVAAGGSTGAASLEASAAQVRILLAMHRTDVAAGVVDAMKAEDEDATLTQLSAAAVGLATGRADAVADATYTYTDLVERHGSTPVLLNGLALCHLAAGRLDEADRLVREALAKDPACAETLVNAIVVATARGKKGELIGRYEAALFAAAPGCAWVRDRAAAEAALDRAIASVGGE
ncbi:hypothetical protein MMPV_008919 [Pyropia vietnamensis]